MARSVAEILTRPFAELTLDDVRQIVADIGEERETLFFERKASVSGNSLAKACSAFANTLGGLLIVGVANDDDTLVGIDPLASEAQLWVKDTLRGLVLPMPPFRARWIETEGDRGLLVVLVEESSTTPHLLTRSGAIYVRNPGSSDPVPIADQRRLLDLAARGERAEQAAVARAEKILDLRLSDVRPIETLALAATGLAADFESRIFARETPDILARTAWGDPLPDERRRREWREQRWHQDWVGVVRMIESAFPRHDSASEEGVVLARNGSVVIYRGKAPRPEGARAESVMETELRAHLPNAIRAAGELLVEHGAHGDLRLIFRLDLTDRAFHFDTDPQRYEAVEPGRSIQVDLWTSFDENDAAERIFREIVRAVGLAPRAV